MPENNRTEVDYYEDGKQVWHVGDDKTREACTSEAIGMFNSLNARSAGHFLGPVAR